MNQQTPPQAMTLFDLISRNWDLGTEIRHVLFNAAGSSLAAWMEDGRIAFVSVKDAEHPETRVRVEADTGRASIRPRSKPLPPPVISDTDVARKAVTPCRLGDQGFAFAQTENGSLWRATARGQTLAMNAASGEAVTALAAVPGSNRLAVAHGRRLTLVAEDGGAEQAGADLQHEVRLIAVSADQKRLACWGDGQLTIVAAEGMKAQMPMACAGDVKSLAWSPCGRWLAAGCEDKMLCLLDTDAGQSDQIVDFPQAVRAVGFSQQAGAMIAAGAFRVVGWDLPDLPFGDHEGRNIETGKPGLTIVDLVAVHPKRDLCAVSYANGLVMICRIGHPDEMLLREGTGVAVNALSWSDDGSHLAIGGADGSLSITTFPKNMFK